MAAKPKPEGMYPEAHPTAPGGMSKANLRLELAEKHGWSMEDSRPLSWPDLIQAVIDGRLAREAEAQNPHHAVDWDPITDPADVFEEIHDPDEEPSADDLLGEFDDLLDGDEEDEEDDSIPEGAVNPEPYNHHVVGPHAPTPAIVESVSLDDPEAEVFDPETLFAEMLAERADEEAKNPPLFLGIPGIKDYVFAGHAGAGPSASERWMHCTMSLSLSKKFLETLSPNQQAQYAVANLAARQGTTAHAVGEAKANHMLGRIDDDELEATLLELAVEPEEGEAYDDEMDEYVNEYVDLIKSYADERGPENMRIETRVEAAIPLDNLHEGEVYIIRGSADVIGMPTEDDPTLIVGDLKYGEGIHVDAEANSQAMIYALGALEELVDEEGNLTVDIEKVVLIIAQPRLGGIKTWEISLDDLLDWRDEVLSPALTKALYGENEGATFNPSKSACQFCPARGGCPALTEQRMEAAAEAFDVIIEAEHGGEEFPETSTLSNERLGSLLSQIAGLIDIHKDLKEEAQRRLHRGTPVPGYLLVNYTPPRKWKDGAQEKLATTKGLTRAERAALLKPQVLVTPKQATVILGEKAAAIKDLYDTPEKKPVVAPEGDRRSKWEGKPPEAMFDDESTPADVVRAAEEMFPDE